MKRTLFFTFFLLPYFILAQQHLLFTEIKIPPSGETNKAFIEIYNPADQAVSLDQLYLANYKIYYEMVNNQYSSNAADFLAKFPNGQIGAKQTMVVALDGAAFQGFFGKMPDFEIKPTDADVSDMVALRIGANPVLDFARGMVILFSWNGSDDLVKDVDYLPWGLIAFNSYWMDKTGVQIDGPDADSISSAYLNDAARSAQKAPTAPSGGKSLQRIGISETDEVTSGGNGLMGHNEATENWKSSFAADSPTPGVFSQTPGDGTGIVTIAPDTIETSAANDLTFTITGGSYTLASVEIIIPTAFQWSQNSDDVQLSGSGAASASKSVNGNQILMEQTQITSTQQAVVVMKNISAPASEGNYGFEIRTAISGGTLTPIGVFPVVSVAKGLTIADIQNNFDQYNGKTVTFTAVVTIGVNITRTDRCDAFVQDASGFGINLSSASVNFPELVRRNKLRVTGTVGDYQGSTQISNFTIELLSTDQSIPLIPSLSTQDANNLDLEGSMIETIGVITDKADNIGGGTNITIDDGSGSVPLRIWNTSGLNLSDFAVGDTIGIHAVIDIYLNKAQLLIGYQQDIYKTQLPVSADGTGRVTVAPDSVRKDELVSLMFTFSATSEDTVAQTQITIPAEWGWSGDPAKVSIDGAFIGAALDVAGKVVSLSAFALTSDENGQVTIHNLTAPNADTASTFIVKTASAHGSLREIESLPGVLVGKGTGISSISIYEARQKSVGSKISIKGVVTIGAGVLRTNFTDAYIQDESGYGINIYRAGTLDNQIKRGNLLILQGELDDYQGKKEIKNYKAILLKTDAEIPAIPKISAFQASTSAYEGSFCEVQGLIMSKSVSGGGTNISLDDGTGAVTVRVWDTAQLDLSGYAVGDYVVIRGVGSLYSGAGQLLLCYQEDIFLPAFDESPVLLKVTARPFVPDKGEKIAIEYSAGTENSHVTLRIFDLGGRLITTLKDGDGLPIPIKLEWNGKNQLGEWVALGTYICHLEVVNEKTGKRSEKIAPIVVGTILR